MSVQQKRFAAATRTAASKRGFRGRVKLTLTWLTVLAALSLFTLTVVGTAAAKKPDVSGAANKLPPNQPIIVIDGKKAVCSVNATQLKLIQADYDTGWMTVKIGGVDTDVVTVTGMKENELKKMLGDGKQVKCEVVQQQHVFYLPFDAQTS
jgi:hypothetical protein